MRLTAIFLALTLAAPAFGFTAQNGMRVERDSATGFSVPWIGRGGPADFWCAAGDFGVRKLHLAPGQKIYRASEPPRRSGEPMRFTLNAEGAASATGLLMLWGDGAGLSVGHAQSLCEPGFKNR